MVPEIKTSISNLTKNNKLVYFPKIDFTIRLFRTPYYVLKNAILPILLLMFLSAGCNFFGLEDTQ